MGIPRTELGTKRKPESSVAPQTAVFAYTNYMLPIKKPNV